jgi:nucleotide-binding universal stress UspA family protein
MNARRILVAYDGSEEAYRALVDAAEAARATDAAIGVVTVLPRIGTALAEARQILMEQGLEPTVHTPVGDAATEIARVARAGAYDVIYVGRRDSGSVARDLERSVSQAVVASNRPTVVAR